MGLKTNHEAIRGVRSGKGVFNGCGLSKTAVNTMTMAAGRVRFGLTAARVAALGGQMLNEGGVEADVAQATLNTAALLAGTYTLYLKTDGSLSTTPEAELALTSGPMIAINVAGTNPLALKMDTPSVRLGTFAVDAASAAAAAGTVTIGGTVRANDVVEVTVAGTKVSYTVLAADDTVGKVAAKVVTAIAANATVNALVSAAAGGSGGAVITLTAKTVGLTGNDITLVAEVTGSGATTTATAGAAKLAGATARGINPATIDYTRRETC